ncbi:MAG: Stp1/IreP family PP2C-type Ser/Thr phosphatase [Gallicola sp.]|nr:Stp1/IreP family PP2C-type Ser/Thr phosphatase [Gallicola sp.]
MRVYSNTDIGMIRDLNEDYYGNIIDEKWALLIVADGMGGHKAGEVASMMAVEAIKDYILEHADLIENRLELVEKAIKEGNKKIYSLASSSEDCSNMGTTVVLVFVEGDSLYAANVGDSRAYLMNRYGFKQISRDHSLVNDLLHYGTITEEEAKNYNRKNVITRSVGLEEDVEVDTIAMELSEGDQLLLCTDGLNGQVEDPEIEGVLQDPSLALEDKVEKLIDMANEAGGMDNVTVTLFVNEEVAE